MQPGKIIWLTSVMLLSACSQAIPPVNETASSMAGTDGSTFSSEEVSVVANPESDGIAKQGAAKQINRDLRDSYYECAASNDGSTWEMQRCIEEEFKYQDDRLNVVYQELLSNLSDEHRKKLMESEREWLSDKDVECKWDAETEGQAQRIEANACALKKTAARVVELEKMLRGVE